MEETKNCEKPSGKRKKKSKKSETKNPDPSCRTLPTQDQSQPVGKIFIEDERGFRAVECTDFYKKTESVTYSPVSVALKVESCFHTFSNFCHGLLAGIALWQSVAAYQLSLSHFHITDFIIHYGFLSQPMQMLFYFLLIICTVSAFDRFDLGNVKLSTAKQVIFCRTKALIILIYPLSLLLSLSISPIDEKFWLYRYNASAWNSSSSQDFTEEVFYWKSLNFARCATAILGWIAVAIEPNVNSLINNLQLQLQ